MPSRFVHLHTHSHYSLLQALPKVKDLVKKAIACDMNALAITDAGNMYGVIDFYSACIKNNIKPILGVDFYVAIRGRKDMEPRIDNKRTRLVMLAKDETGYKNLIKLTTDANLEGFYYKPRIDREIIEKYPQGLVVIMPSFSGAISLALDGDNEVAAKELADFYKKTFGDDFYLEISHHPEIEGHQEKMQKVIAFARKENIPLVAAHDVYYIKPEDKKARETLIAIQDQFSERSREDNADFSFITGEQAEEFFKETPDALDNCQKIVEKCNLTLTLGKWYFPDYIVESGREANEELRVLTYEGLKVRNLEATEEVTKRIDYELEVIKNKGFAKYFLVVADLLRYAHAHGILTNIRGSVAGSIVTYLNKITSVNPIEYKLPFERFLNPERPSAPDIDMDYADNRRDEIIQYARQKYGDDKVAQIGTFGTMMARGAVRDVARAMGYPYSTGDLISKMIPMGAQGFPMTIDHAIELVPELKAMYEKDEDAKDIIDMAKKIEGCARHISVHAAGVVISPVPLNEMVPLQLDPKGKGHVITQYDMRAVGEDNVGLLKFDFLGITNLSQLKDAIDLTEQIEGVKIDLDNIPIDDKKTFEMLARGETEGLFQLNGDGMTKYLKELKPTTIHDINAMVALYRPGPLESIPQYIERKHNPELVTYLDPRMQEILDQSYGVITYQDDVMMIAIKIAGYSWLEADKLRKAMGKKIPEEMAAQKEKLLKGFKANKLSDKKADQLWKLIEPFAAYGFNKAHAASYGRLAYQTAYMKANYPAIYMAAVLTGAHGEVEEIAIYITECRRMGIEVLPPNINESFADFTVIKAKPGETTTDGTGKTVEMKDRIRFGLSSIKNFGEGIANAIIAERKRGGPFKSLEDFLSRVKDRNLNKKSLESLIKAGAMDAYGDRGILMFNLDSLLHYNKEQQNLPDSSDSLFGSLAGHNELPPINMEEKGKVSKDQQLAWEKELLGLYISGHPLDKYREILNGRDQNIAKIKKDGKDKMPVVIAGLIEEVKEIMTKGNPEKDQPPARMAFVRIRDLTGDIEAVVFPKTYEQFRAIIQPDFCIIFSSKLSMRNGEPSLLIDHVKKLN